MSTIKNLVTQSEIKKLIDGLGSIADNLNLHVNHSLSKAHGMTGLDSIYYDSGGDVHATRVVRLVIGNQVYYAPAALLVSGDPGPSATNSGLILSSSADPATDVSVGTPTEATLVTSFGDSLNAAAQFANDLLRSHAGSNHDAVHGTMSVLAQPVLDSANHTVGRYTATFKYNGQLYRIPVDTDPNGPPQPPRLSGPTDVVDVGHAVSPSHRANPSPFVVTVLGGTLPITFQWAINESASAYPPPPALGSWIDLDGPDGTSVTAGAGAFETQYFGATTAMLTLRPSTNAVFTFRVAVTNPAGTFYRTCTLYQYAT